MSFPPVNDSDMPDFSSGGSGSLNSTNSSGGSDMLNMSGSIQPAPLACFLEGTEILCANDIYRPIETLRPGMKLRSLNGSRAIHSIGRSIVFLPDNDIREIDRLYRYDKEKNNGLTMDLILTGGHSVLLKEASENQLNAMIKNFNAIFVTEDHIRLMACMDGRAEPYRDPCGKTEHTIYHVALESNDPDTNYGIYANGWLVESCQQSVLKKKMTLL